jgi:sugar phosphate isomerase/epimerase
MTNGEAGISRRGFMKGVGAGVGAAAVAAANAGAQAAGTGAAPASAAGGDGAGKSDGKIRLGAVSWNFRSISAGPPWTEAIDIIGDLGFEGVEVICAAPDQLDATLAEPHFSDLRRQLERRKMVIPQFVLFQSLVGDLGSPDADKRKRTLDLFAKGCAVAAKLGAPMINIVAPWPAVYRKEGYGYLPRYYSTDTTMPGPKFRFDVPRGFDWNKAWAEFVDTVKQATAAAKAAGVRFSLENHTHTFVQNADLFVTLWKEVADPALGMNVDIGWIQSQREYPVVALYKAGRQLFNVHLRDIDGFGYRFVPPGCGAMDFPGVVLALRALNFSGFLSFEQDGVPDQRYALRRGREILDGLLAMSDAELENAQKRD